MPDVTERAMLARLTIHQWQARKHDRKATQAVADANAARYEAGRYMKRLVAKESLVKIGAAAGELRRYFTENTLPWLDEGQRILPSPEYLRVAQGVRERRVPFDSEVRAFIDAYPALRDAAPLMLGNMFHEADYPAFDEIMAKFGVEFRVAPVPLGKDFRVGLDQDLEQELRAQVTQDTTNALAEAHRSLWLRVHETVINTVNRLKAYEVDADGKVIHTFRDSAIGNLRELVDLLPRLNIAGDTDLDRMCQRLRQELCQLEPETLRDSEAARQGAIEAGGRVLADMAWLIGPARTQEAA
jgi:hypothetical protein